MDDTQEISPNSSMETEGNSEVPQECFLVLEGIKVVPLLKKVINIGRRFENDLVIDDPRVSRYHAQLRVVDGKYELVDMNSTGGTYVNGMRITRCILYAGDAISLSGFSMVYRQHDAPPRTDMRETSPLRSDDDE
jgi:pSer/pThr/pTyr-binding forkhead associated (FHA) protein